MWTRRLESRQGSKSSLPSARDIRCICGEKNISGCEESDRTRVMDPDGIQAAFFLLKQF